MSFVSAGKVTDSKKVPKNAILLSKVESLTFRNGKMTTARRVSAVPQMTCSGPSEICKLYNVEVMRCTNEGADYDAENIQWSCRADLPEEFKLGATDVACEGYASSDDPYVLKGSCGVEYRLVLTDKGEEKFGHLGDSEGTGPGSNIATIIFFLIFGLVLFMIIKGMTDSCRRNPPRLGGGDQRPPWFGGGGDTNNDDPPPPYDSHFQSPPGKPRSSGPRTNTASSSRIGQQGWRPGPWTAGAAGAGLGYMMGRNSNRTQTQTTRPSTSFFGGGGAGPSTTRSTSSSSFSGTRHESTGFGGRFKSKRDVSMSKDGLKLRVTPVQHEKPVDRHQDNTLPLQQHT